MVCQRKTALFYRGNRLRLGGPCAKVVDQEPVIFIGEFRGWERSHVRDHARRLHRGPI